MLLPNNLVDLSLNSVATTQKLITENLGTLNNLILSIVCITCLAGGFFGVVREKAARTDKQRSNERKIGEGARARAKSDSLCLIALGQCPFVSSFDLLHVLYEKRTKKLPATQAKFVFFFHCDRESRK